MAVWVEERKRQKYAHLDSTHHFEAFTMETSGIIGPSCAQYLTENQGDFSGEECTFYSLNSIV